MRIVAFSDTHGKHREIDNIPNGDVLIFAGDMTKTGRIMEVVDFANWLERLPHKYKIVIAGNHDFCFDGNKKEEAVRELEDRGIVYLEDDYITVQDKLFYGSPRSATFDNYVFQAEDYEWEINDDVDVLITHGPPKNCMDYSEGYGNVGCEKLAQAKQGLNLEAHVFGHIHEVHGKIDGNMNVSILDEHYRVKNWPIVFDLE